MLEKSRVLSPGDLEYFNAEPTADTTDGVELHQQQTGEASEAGADLDREEIDVALVGPPCPN